MIIIDPVAMGDAACTRASPKWVWDRTGTLVEVPANTLGVTYDPTDLSKPPYALVEAEETNHIRNNTMQGAEIGSPGVQPTTWFRGAAAGLTTSVVGFGISAGIDYIDLRWSGVPTSTTDITTAISSSEPVAPAQVWAESAYLAVVGGSLSNIGTVRLRANLSDSGGAFISTVGLNSTVRNDLDDQLRLFEGSLTVEPPNAAFLQPQIGFVVTAGQPIDVTFRIGLPQLARNTVPQFPIKTFGTAFTRAADVISPTAGLIYSNVPMVEPPYSATTTYAKDAAVYDPVTKIVYWSMQAANSGKPLSDPAWWNKRTAINRWAMLDDRNDTQTEGNEDILIVLSARAITQGLYLGNLDANEIRIAMTDQKRGLVYTETRSQVVSRSMASFYRWAFKRIRRRSYFLTLKLPVYANALVTILIRRPGGVAKCGMCMLGPATDVGLSHYGLSTELKDFSDTSFNPDGTSRTVVRGYAKRMSVDVEVDNQEIDDVEEELIAFRQKVVVYVGTVLFGSAMLVGKFSSLKKVIPGLRKSRLSLQVEGVVTK